MIQLTYFEIGLILTLLIFEQVFQGRQYATRPSNWIPWLIVVQVIAISVLLILSLTWQFTSLWQPLLDFSMPMQVLITYLTYSFFAYWYHRMRHSVSWAWKYLHYAHHAPQHMTTLVTVFRHPIELLVDAGVIFAVGWLLLGVDLEVMLAVILVESSFEFFHHSNIRLPKCLHPIGWVIQIPEQHLIHHQRGLHAWNYGTLTLWDSLFGTLRLPSGNETDLGLNEWPDILSIMLYRYKRP